MSRGWLGGLALVAAVIVVYLPVWRAGFLWDDEAVLTTNPCIIGPLGLKEIWTTRAADICPLTLTTFWAEHKLWGLAPLPYHLVNVLLQGGGAVALWRVLLRLKIPGAWFGAALWALHPVQVESVAWISEMKNTESGLFYLLAILFFLRGLEKRVDGNYGWSLLFAALAMTSKSSTVILPLVLLLVAWWMEGRWRLRNLAKVAPIFLMSVALGLVSIWTQQLSGSDNPQWLQSWPQRLATAGAAVWFYLRKLAWPHPLMLIYPRWEIDASSWLSYLPSLGALVVLAIFWSQRKGWSRPWLLAWSYFLVALLPVLGFVNMSYQWHSYVSDHFQYLAGMGPLALVAAGGARFAEGLRLRVPWLPVVLGAGGLAVLGAVSWQRALVYNDEVALWTDTLAKNPDSWGGHNNLGNALLKRDLPEQALVEFRKALAINPNDSHAYFNLGRALDREGELDEAMAAFRKALDIDPGYLEAHNNLGVSLLKQGQLDAAMTELQAALEINPAFVQALNNLGIALGRVGRLDEAMAEFQKSLAIDPDDAEAHNDLGNVLALKGRMEEAIAQFHEALRLRPGYPSAENNLSRAETLTGGKTPPK